MKWSIVWDCAVNAMKARGMKLKTSSVGNKLKTPMNTKGIGIENNSEIVLYFYKLSTILVLVAITP